MYFLCSLSKHQCSELSQLAKDRHISVHCLVGFIIGAYLAGKLSYANSSDLKKGG